MTDTEPQPREGSGKLSRRDFLKLAAATAAAVALAGCGPLPENSPGEPKVDVSGVFPLIERGRARRTREDLEMLQTTIAGFDLALRHNSTVAAFKQIPDYPERIFATIGWLGVEEQGISRYNRDSNLYSGYSEEEKAKLYFCNTYAIDLLTALLGNQVIGSRYWEKDGSPAVYGKADSTWSTEQTDEINRQYPCLDANNTDGWMKDHGINHGWESIGRQEALMERLSSGAIAMGVTKEGIQRPAIGHMFVLTTIPRSDRDNDWVVSQATSNKMAIPFPSNSKHEKVNPEVEKFNFWVHKLP